AQGCYVDSALEQIKKVEQSDIDVAAKNTLISTLNRSLAHQLNLEDIVEKAVNSPDLKVEADPGGIDPEWAEKFEEHAGSKYDEDAKSMWARLLTGELNRPGTFSRKAMRILDDMEREDAEAFDALCSRCAGGLLPWGERQQLLPLFIGRGEELALQEGNLAGLKGLGLIEFDGAVGGMFESTKIGDGGWLVLKVGHRLLGVRFPEDKGYEVMLRRFTRYGEELAQLCELGSDLEEGNLLINKFKDAGGEVVLVTGQLPDGQFTYLPL
ncbi:DUF2806 domain-containing protein, partial [Paratractidigestivibacter sp.]|uniref:DUF2806 domain-containing protein n=1 Tax=Paratractidigestivibacter sp. TaxID=2847316 RepID=UPI002ACB13A9